VFHFVFGLRSRPEPLHLAHYLCLESCLQVNAPDAVVLHHGREPFGRYWRLLRNRVSAEPIAHRHRVSIRDYRQLSVARYRYAHEADFVRLEVLAAGGGVYADIDTMFLKPLPKELFDKPFVIGREADVVQRRGEPATPALCNALLMAESGSLFAQMWLERMPKAFDGSWSAHSTELPQLLHSRHPELVHVEPQTSFYPYMWTRTGIADMLERLVPQPDDAYSMHLWSHLWWRRRRRDFSSFHAGLLTEEYIRAARTTYARAAKPYLPVMAPKAPRCRRSASTLDSYPNLAVPPESRATDPPARMRPNAGSPRWRQRQIGADAVTCTPGDDDIHTSVVIVAYRAEATLPSVLEMLATQIGPGREAILVTSGTDEPAPIRTESWPWLRVISVRRRLLPGAARNLGAAHARGALLAFLDADAVPCGEWLTGLENALTADTDAVGGAILNGTPTSRIGTAEYLLTCSETLPHRPRPIRHAPGSNLLVRSRYFHTIGGFSDELRAGEDTALTYPLARRRRLGFAPEAVVTHSNRTELRSFLVNQRLQGAAFVAVCQAVAYPNDWVCRGPALLLAGPLRLLALARCVLWNPSYVKAAAKACGPMLLGTIAWALGAFEAQRQSEGP
jgi:hypothetical protein